MKEFHNRYQLLTAGILRKHFVWPENSSDHKFTDYFLRESRRDGIQLLIHDFASSSPEWDRWPEKVCQTLTDTARHDAIIDVLRQQDLLRLLNILKEACMMPVLLKGAALALTHYSQPHLRTRTDTDILIGTEDFKRIPALMKSSGYESAGRITGGLVNYQAGYHRKTSGGVFCFYDIHAKLLNPHYFSDVLTYAEILKDANTAEIFGEPVKVISERHALLHACMHRIAHHYGDSKQIWLYDIHLMLSGKTSEWLETFYELAALKKMRKICGASLLWIRRWFQTEIPDAWIRRFTDCDEFEPSSQFLHLAPTRFSFLMMNMSALSGSERLKLLLENLFPPADFIRTKYRDWPGVPVFLLYGVRMISGISRAFMKVGRND